MKELKTKESLRIFELDENKKYIVYVEVQDLTGASAYDLLLNAKKRFNEIGINNIILVPMSFGKVVVNIEEVPSESTE